MSESNLSIIEKIKDLYQHFLKSTQIISKNSLSRDDLFKQTCRKIADRNEAKVIQDIV